MDADRWGAVDQGDVVIVRAVRDAAIAEGFGSAELEAAVDEALAGREAAYDFLVLLNTAELPTVFPGAQAFHRPYNSDGVTGIGRPPSFDADRPLLAALWMNAWDDWDRFGTDRTAWVFAQEIGHQWLAYATFDDGAGRRNDLLGRGLIHWSYYANTGNSPMEGNAWIDHGDGTFTTDLDAEPSFCPLDLYFMGFLGAEDVPPTFFVDDPIGPRTRESDPEHVQPSFGPITVTGTRVDVTVDQVIAAIGPRTPGPDESQRDFAVLPVLVMGPGELLTRAVLDGVTARMAEFEAAWDRYAGDHSTMTFAVEDEGRSLPPLDPVPALVPRAAW